MGMGVVVGAEDRISALPDHLLHHILSFLPTKYSFRTSILSKRWKNVWVFNPVLDLRDWDPDNYENIDFDLYADSLMNFVDRTLSLHHHDMPNIKKFYFKENRVFNIDLYIDESRVNAWISTLIMLKVEELILINDRRCFNPFPLSLFTCESLTTLDLDVEMCLDLPESISLPRLKILRLKYIQFVDENLTQQFFSNCPVLEELLLANCSGEINVLSISAPALKCFFIKNCYTNDCVIQIYAPRLLSFSYETHVGQDFVLHSFSSLVDANICLSLVPVEQKHEIGYAASKLIGGLSNVKLLKLSGDSFKALSFADNLLTNLPIFSNLTHLEVSSAFPSSTNTILLNFLQISPNLESLVFAKGFKRSLSYDNDDDWRLKLVPRCLLLHLKSVEFREFCGESREINAVQLFLKNAKILQRMTIIFQATLSTCWESVIMRKNRIMQQILMFPRGSTGCVVDLS